MHRKLAVVAWYDSILVHYPRRRGSCGDRRRWKTLGLGAFTDDAFHAAPIFAIGRRWEHWAMGWARSDRHVRNIISRCVFSSVPQTPQTSRDNSFHFILFISFCTF